MKALTEMTLAELVIARNELHAERKQMIKDRTQDICQRWGINENEFNNNISHSKGYSSNVIPDNSEMGARERNASLL